MQLLQLDAEDYSLVQAAQDVLERNYHPVRHTVGAAVLCPSGRTFTGINVEACGYGPCAEPIAIGAAFSHGERDIIAIVAVCKKEDHYPILSPCGNCRQLLVDYAPDALVILDYDGQIGKTAARNLLPAAYLSDFEVC
jgi:cytidine deaminase